MNKKNLVKLTTVVALLAGGAYISCSKQTVSAASWGAKTLFTTPKATRGTWYYKENGKIKRWKITAHTSKGRKLYKVLPEKEYTKWEYKLEHQNTRNYRKISNKLDNSQWQAFTFKWHGITSFNTNGWLAGAGDGVYYVPVTKTRYGRKVPALRFGSGAGNWLDIYAYRSPKLAK